MSPWHGLVDAHCHGSAKTLSAAAAAGVTGWVLNGLLPTDHDNGEAAQVPGAYCAVGLHPWCADALPLADAMAAIAARLHAAVAVGEMGLDHKRATTPNTRAHQLRVFRAQLALARERDLPIVLHVVGAHGAALEVLRADGVPAAGGLVHGFSGALEVAQDYLQLGLSLSVGALAANPRARKLQRTLPAVPADRLLVETDDGPLPLPAVVAAVAAARGEPTAETARYTSANARALFRPLGVSR